MDFTNLFKAFDEIEDEVSPAKADRKSSLNESVSKKAKEGLVENFRGAKDIEFIWHGETNDPELEYKGTRFNYWDVENALWDDFKASTGVSDSDDSPETEERFNKFVQDNAPGMLDDWISAKLADLHIEDGHTEKEFFEKFGDAYNDGDIWDFSEDDLLNGAIEPDPAIQYWRIGDRIYETPLPIKESKECKEECKDCKEEKEEVCPECGKEPCECKEKEEDKKELVEEPVYAMEPHYDSRKSFYGKAHVDDRGSIKVLYSYDSPVAMIKDGEVILGKATNRGYPYSIWKYSPTTLRHVKEFLKQNGFKAETQDQMEKDYKVDFINESLKESDLPAPKSIEDCQKWVDYDMKKYGKISDNTNEIIKKAGFQIIKDDHGDYEVAAGKFESLKEDYDDFAEAFDGIKGDLITEVKKVFPDADVDEDDIIFDDSRAWSLYIPGHKLGLPVGKFGAYRNYMGGGVRGSLQNNGREKDGTVELGKLFQDKLAEIENLINAGFEGEEWDKPTGVLESKKEEESKPLKEEKVSLTDEKEVSDAIKEIDDSKDEKENIEVVIDANAEVEDDLNVPHVGDVILTCSTCKAHFFKKPEEVKKDETPVKEGDKEIFYYNSGEECPVCHAESGYEISGQVGQFEPEEEKEPEAKEETEIKEIETVPEEEPAEEVEESFDRASFDRAVNNSLTEKKQHYRTLKAKFDKDEKKFVVEGLIISKGNKEPVTLTFALGESKDGAVNAKLTESLKGSSLDSITLAVEENKIKTR